MEQKDKKTERIEQAQKVASVIDKGVSKADEVMDSAKKKAGAVGSKVQVGLVIVAILAMIRDSGMIWILAGVLAILFSGKLIEMYKKMSEKKEEQPKSEEKK